MFTLVTCIRSSATVRRREPPIFCASEVRLNPEFIPDNAVIFDQQRHERYDYEGEAIAAEGVVEVLLRFKRAGLDASDKRQRVDFRGACDALSTATAESPAPDLCDDPRLIGDWQLVGTNSPSLFEMAGYSGLGKAPFTQPHAIFFTFTATGVVVCKEVLEFFGKPVVLNELRGKFGFDETGALVQEQYSEADMGGQRNSAAFAGATLTFLSGSIGGKAAAGSCITADGAMRLAAQVAGNEPSYMVYKRLPLGALESFLSREKLPMSGGTVPPGA